MIDFVPIRSRLDRAESLIGSLHRELTAYWKTEPIELRHEADVEAGVQKWTLSRMTPPPPVLSHIVGECVHNIRASLDNMLWSFAEGLDPSERSHVVFIVADTEERFEKKLKGKGTRDLPRPVLDATRKVQPFVNPPSRPRVIAEAIDGGGRVLTKAEFSEMPWDEQVENTAVLHPLWVLHTLWNADKHRAPPLVAVASQECVYGHTDVVLPPMEQLRPFLTAATLVEGSTVFQVDYPPIPENSGVRFQFSPAFDLVLGLEPGPREPVGPLLIRLLNHVRNVVVPEFERLQ